MLRRQAGFLLASDPASSDYLRSMASTELRKLPTLASWTPSWPVARGLSIAQAVAGDQGPLHAFLDHGLTSDVTLQANLRYYAHWTADNPDHQCADDFMAEGPDDWRGDRLLDALLGSLTASSPYVELTIRSLWSLLRARPHLLADPVCCARVESCAEVGLGAAGLRAGARRELSEVVAWSRRAGNR